MIKIINEKESIDKYFRNKALDIYRDIKNWFDENIDKLIKRNTLYGDPWVNDNFKRIPKGGFLLDYDNLFNENLGLDFILVPEQRKEDYKIKGGLGEYQGKTILLLDVLLDNWNLTYINNRMEGIKNIFLHELIHYFDFQRSGEHSNSAKTSIVQDYYNNPFEFNAFYQEGINKLEDYIKNDTIRNRIFNNLDMDFEDFYKKVIGKNFFDKEFIKNLNRRNEKALIKRLYDFFIEIKKEVNFNDTNT